MSGRLDQTLESIIDGKKKAQRDVRRKKARKPGKVVAPVGGIKKVVKPVRSAVKAPSGPSAKQSQTSKIVVSGLPFDVNEAQIKEYFQKSVGPVKKVSLHYNQSGQSRGIVDIIFSKPDAAAKAAKEQNDVRVDGRPMRIEVVVDAKSVPEPTPAKSLSERVAYAKPRSAKSAPLTKDSANPKAQPKSATATKATAGKKDNKKKTARKGRSNRPKPKTQEELDAEMTDYWGGNNSANGTAADAATAVAPAAAATGDDTGMEEIS